jgi:hypothetical protein
MIKAWTAADEAAYQALAKERAERLEVQRKPVIRVVTSLVSFPKFREETVEHIADIFIQRADAIRDALEPFDSGVRVSESPI